MEKPKKMNREKIIENLEGTLKKPILDKSMKANIEGKLKHITLGTTINK